VHPPLKLIWIKKDALFNPPLIPVWFVVTGQNDVGASFCNTWSARDKGQNVHPLRRTWNTQEIMTSGGWKRDWNGSSRVKSTFSPHLSLYSMTGPGHLHLQTDWGNEGASNSLYPLFSSSNLELDVHMSWIKAMYSCPSLTHLPWASNLPDTTYLLFYSPMTSLSFITSSIP